LSSWNDVLDYCRTSMVAFADKEHAISQKLNAAIAVIGIDIGKNSFHMWVMITAVPSCCGRSGHGARWNAARQPADVLDQYGGLRRRASSQSQAPYAWSRRPPE
jgi:hypothetical protein